MKLILFSLLLLAVLANNHKGHHQVQWHYEHDVLVLNSANFDHAVKNFHTVLVDFYAPWCPHCQDLAPKFATAAAKLKEHGVYLAKVDCTREDVLADRFKIHGYPTLKIFTENIEYTYHGRRNPDEIVSYMLAHLQGYRVAQNNYLHRKLEKIEAEKAKHMPPQAEQQQQQPQQ